jgi:hypothetical protein
LILLERKAFPGFCGTGNPQERGIKTFLQDYIPTIKTRSMYDIILRE